MLEPLMNNLVTPLLQSMGESMGEGMGAPLPPEFSEKMGKIKFDYEAYQKDGDEYLAKFEKEVEANFGDDFEKSMEKWASQFEKNGNKRGGAGKVYGEVGRKLWERYGSLGRIFWRT